MTVDEQLAGRALIPYAIGDPGRAAREVVPRLAGDASFPAEMRIDGGTAGPLTVRAASRRGLSHAYDGRPRQDDYAILANDRWLVIAVADGVSSAPMSHHVATIASRQSVAFMEQVLDRTGDVRAVPWERLVHALARTIVDHGSRFVAGDERAATAENVAAVMATTLVIAVADLRIDVGGYHEGAFLALGDTSVYALDAARGWERLSCAKDRARGAASNTTHALPLIPPGGVAAIPLQLQHGGAMFVMTDGVADALGGGDGVVGRHLMDLWLEPPDPVTFCAQVGFARRTFDDDRTVVGVWAQEHDRAPRPTHTQPEDMP